MTRKYVEICPTLFVVKEIQVNIFLILILQKINLFIFTY